MQYSFHCVSTLRWPRSVKDRKSTRLNSSHPSISYAVFCLKKKKFSLLPPGNYSVKFSSPGFQTAEVPSVTVNVTETAVLNHALQVGGQSIQVTVEATTEAI